MMKKNYINMAEEKEYCFDNIYNLGLMLKDNYELFGGMLDSETIEHERNQKECLSFLLPISQFKSFCEFLYKVCFNAGQLRLHEYGGYTYIKFKDDLFYLNVMEDKRKIYQFALIDEIPQEDSKMVPFDILEYGLDSIGELFDKDRKKCLKNACIKYKVEMIERPDMEFENYYYITNHSVAYRFEIGFDALMLKRLAMVYYCWAKPRVKRPVFNDLALHLEAWNIALQQMKKDGIKLLGNNDEKYYIKDKILRNFINLDIMAFFHRSNGLFEEKQIPKVQVNFVGENAHVEKRDVQKTANNR